MERNITILLADDEEMVRNIISESLQIFGFSVILAQDGAEAVELFKSNKEQIDLLLFDISMPRKNGVKAFKEILEISPKAKAIFLSGYFLEDEHTMEIIAKGYTLISKPVSPIELVNIINKALL